MVFRYDAQSSQWATSPRDDFIGFDAETQTRGSGQNDSSASRALAVSSKSPQSSPKAEDNDHESTVNLFWDHWRLRTSTFQGTAASAIEIKKEAERGGRSYTDVESLEDGSTHPSHLLISLP